LRPEKEQKIAEIRDMIGRANGIYFVDFTGINVAQADELRREMRQFQVEYRVVKNSLARLAIIDTPIGSIESHLQQPTALVLGYDDPLVPLKVLNSFIRKYEIPKIKVSILEGRVFSAEQTKELSKIPSRENLYERLLGQLNAPITSLVGVLGGPIRDLIDVLYALKDKKEQENE